MKTLFYISKLIYPLLAGGFLWRFFSVRKEDPQLTLGTNLWIMFQIVINAVLVIFGIYSRYTEQTAALSWGLNIGGMLVLYLFLVRLVLGGREKMMLKGRAYDIGEITAINARTFSVRFEMKEKSVTVFNYIGRIAPIAAQSNAIQNRQKEAKSGRKKDRRG